MARCGHKVAKLYDTPNCNALILTAVCNNSRRSLARLTSEERSRLSRGAAVSDVAALAIYHVTSSADPKTNRQ